MSKGFLIVMKRKSNLKILILLGLLYSTVTTGCISTPKLNYEMFDRFRGTVPIDVLPASNRKPNLTGDFRHVIIIGVDGLRADEFYKYLESEPNSFLGQILGKQLNLEGGIVGFQRAIWSAEAVTVFPSYTYPAWTSLLTGEFPGSHGITGNQTFFRKSILGSSQKKDIPVARYYTEEHADAMWVYWAGLLNDDISNETPTLYQKVKKAGGQSLVINHMIGKGVEPLSWWRVPSYDTARLYLSSESKKYDESAIYEFVSIFKALNNGRFPDRSSPVYLPTLTMIYLPGLDHATHMAASSTENEQLTYMRYVDKYLRNLFFPADIARTKPDMSIEEIQHWPGLLNYEELMKETLFVLISDHGHSMTPEKISNSEIEEVLSNLNIQWGQGTNLKVHKTRFWLYGLLDKFGLGPEYTGDPTEDENAFITINGGSAGIYLKRPNHVFWDERTEFDAHNKEVAEGIWNHFHIAKPNAVAAVFARSNNGYLEYSPPNSSSPGSNPGYWKKLDESARDYGPDWKRRLKGLFYAKSGISESAPDILLLANKGYTFTNNQLPWTAANYGGGINSQLRSDHGNLHEADSQIPIIFFSGKFESKTPLPPLLKLSIVDVAPTILDALNINSNNDSQNGANNAGTSRYKEIKDILSGSSTGCNQKDRLVLNRENLASLVRRARLPEEGFSIKLDSIDETVDTWTTADALAALLPLLNSTTSDTIEPYRKIITHIINLRQPEGWALSPSLPPSTEVTSWVGLALLEALNVGNLLPTDDLNKIKDAVREVYTELIYRQNYSGGWHSYRLIRRPSLNTLNNGRFEGEYASVIALTFLLKLKESALKETALIEVDRKELDVSITEGIRRIMAKFDGKGWKEGTNSSLSPDLATLNLLVLTEAKRLGLQVEIHQQYRAGRAAWLQLALEASNLRDVIERHKLTQDLLFFNERDGDRPQCCIQFKATILWYPWSLLLASRLAEDSDLSLQDRRDALKLYNNLTERLSEAVSKMNSLETFIAAETIIAISSILNTCDDSIRRISNTIKN